MTKRAFAVDFAHEALRNKHARFMAAMDPGQREAIEKVAAYIDRHQIPLVMLEKMLVALARARSYKSGPQADPSTGYPKAYLPVGSDIYTLGAM